jgi:hypothetical protein
MKLIILLFVLIPLSGCVAHTGTGSYTPHDAYIHTPYQADIQYPLPREYGPSVHHPYDNSPRVIINPWPAYIPRAYRQWQHYDYDDHYRHRRYRGYHRHYRHHRHR